MAKIWLDRNTIKETVEVEKTFNLTEIEQGIEFYTSQVNEAQAKLTALEAERDAILQLPNRPQK